MRHGIRAALATILLLPATAVQGSSPQIRGAVYEGEEARPSSGALVALYDAGNLLADFTYSRDNGEFRLQTPAVKGHFFLVASRDGRASRDDFAFDPAAGSTLWLTLRLAAPATPENPLLRAGRWLAGQLGAVVALLVGFFFRSSFEERWTARTKWDYFRRDLRAAIDDTLQRVPEVTPMTATDRLGEATKAVRSLAKFLDRHGDVQHDVDKLKKVRGKFREAKTAVDGMVVELEQAAARGGGNEQAKAMGRVRQELQGLKNDPRT